MKLHCRKCDAVRVVLKHIDEDIDVECDECLAEEWLAANGKTKRGQTMYRKGFKIGVGAQWDPDFELTPAIAEARRRNRKPITAESRKSNGKSNGNKPGI